MENKQSLSSSGIFFDSSDLDEFQKWYDSRILGGATTNPLILANDGVLDLPGHIAKMIRICGPNFPISIEIPDSEMTKKNMINLALKYHRKFPKNAIIKVPMDPREPQKSFEVAYVLGQYGVRVNATLGLSSGQLIGAAEALRYSKAKGGNYISLFWARREEAREQIVRDLMKVGEKRPAALKKVPGAAECLSITLRYLEKHNLSLKVIVGSIRTVDQVEEAFSLGAHIVTITPPVLEKWIFTQRGVETADEFNQAYRGIKDKFKLI